MRNQYLSNAPWDIPRMENVGTFDAQGLKVIGFDNLAKKNNRACTLVHSFVDDTHLDSLYNNPDKLISTLSQFRYLLSPDFSLYTDMPLALQLYNTFKNRWCGRYWQQLGLSVIPTISWGTEKSFSFCFEGVPEHSIVAVSTIGCRLYKQNFLLGYRKMLEIIDPALVLCFDTPFPEMEGEILRIKTKRGPTEEE